jgi:hypothetical protein
VNAAGANLAVTENGIGMPAPRNAAPAMLFEFWLIGEYVLRPAKLTSGCLSRHQRES